MISSAFSFPALAATCRKGQSARSLHAWICAPLILHPVSPSAITRAGSDFGRASDCAFTEADFAPDGIEDSHTGRSPSGIGCRSDIGRLTPSIWIEGHSRGLFTTIRATAFPSSPNSTQAGVSAWACVAAAARKIAHAAIEPGKDLEKPGASGKAFSRFIVIIGQPTKPVLRYNKNKLR